MRDDAPDSVARTRSSGTIQQVEESSRQPNVGLLGSSNRWEKVEGFSIRRIFGVMSKSNAWEKGGFGSPCNGEKDRDKSRTRDIDQRESTACRSGRGIYKYHRRAEKLPERDTHAEAKARLLLVKFVGQRGSRIDLVCIVYAMCSVAIAMSSLEQTHVVDTWAPRANSGKAKNK
jgi:hypothetical protein